MINIRASGGSKVVSSVKVRVSGSSKEVSSIKIRRSGALVTAYEQGGGGNAFAVNVIPLTPFGAASSNTNVSVTTESVGVTASGGVAPYTYAFSFVDGDGGWSISVTGPGQARFTKSSVGPDESWQATFKCTVTDAAGRQVDSPPIDASVTNYGRF